MHCCLSTASWDIPPPYHSISYYTVYYIITITYHIITILYHTLSYHTISHHSTLYHIILYSIITISFSYHIISYRIIYKAALREWKGLERESGISHTLECEGGGRYGESPRSLALSGFPVTYVTHHPWQPQKSRLIRTTQEYTHFLTVMRSRHGSKR